VYPRQAGAQPDAVVSMCYEPCVRCLAGTWANAFT